MKCRQMSADWDDYEAIAWHAHVASTKPYFSTYWLIVIVDEQWQLQGYILLFDSAD
jgi:hypothetical protein